MAMVPMIIAISLLTFKSIYWVNFFVCNTGHSYARFRNFKPSTCQFIYFYYVKHAYVMFCLFIFSSFFESIALQ